MTQLNRFELRTALFALTLTVSLLAVAGCVGKQTTSTMDTGQPQVVVRPMSPSAQANYDYLVYMDKLQQLRQDAQKRGVRAMSREEAAKTHAEAVAALDRILAIDPSPQLYVEKAGLFWNHPEGTALSRKALNEGLARYPDNRMLTVYLANAYIADERLDDAIKVMDGFISRHPDDIDVLEQLGQILMEAGKDAEALDALNKIPEAKRGPETLYTMGRVQGNLGMRKAAIANLKKTLKLDPGFTEALVELAYQYEMSKDYVAAEKIYSSILEENEAFYEARSRLISLNLKLNNPDRALELAMDGPPTKEFVIDAALMFIDNGFYAQGSTTLDRLATDTDIPAEYFFYKAVIADQGENDQQKALSYLNQVDPHDRLYPHALRFQAQILASMGRVDDALSIAVTGKERYPNASIFYILEASLLRLEKNYTGAEEALKQGLLHRRNDPELTYELAMIYEALNRRAEGLELMEQVVRAHPDNANALNYVGYTLAEEGRELDRALVLVTKASNLDPENGYILDSVAWVHFKRGEFEKAWKYIQYAVDVVQKDPTIWEHYGDIATRTGNTKAARKGYKLSLKHKTSNADTVKEKLKNL
ncbi:tetratricopeptide repeat protein [Pseudodesulfovibrio sediminis]|uniref:Tetratricopeptide repeat protein n=1 Tax=Pseudodesulfovibrio sediminis TaxID=2810563 RepID=A0ABM7P794_9BACT|nr:tetratricopeptide repeat protein [Pseudodesulfovibrio sediminis]BCS88821.1 hypothetical protein PSDVSF_20630 [Pseudodesulfovibrio sediminis]